MIPMVDLKTQYTLLKKDIDRAIAEVLASTKYIQGPQIRTLVHLQGIVSLFAT